MALAAVLDVPCPVLAHIQAATNPVLYGATVAPGYPAAQTLVPETATGLLQFEPGADVMASRGQLVPWKFAPPRRTVATPCGLIADVSCSAVQPLALCGRAMLSGAVSEAPTGPRAAEIADESLAIHATDAVALGALPPAATVMALGTL